MWNDTISGTQCLSLLRADWALSDGHSKDDLGDWKSLLLCPCINSIPATIAILLISPFVDDKCGWAKRLTGIHKMGHHPIHLIIKIPFCWGHPLVSIHRGHKYIHIFFLPYSEMSIHIIPLPQISFQPIFQSFSFQVHDHSTKVLTTAHELLYNHTSGHFSFHVKWKTRCVTQSSAHWENLFSSLSFRDIWLRGCSAAAIHFWVVPACCSEPYLNQAQDSPPLSANHRKLPSRP